MPTMEFRCIAARTEKGWMALCIDLDIAIEGPSLDAVRHDLAKAIELHLDTVKDLPEPDRRALLHRPTPWWIVLRYRLRILKNLFTLRKSADRISGFTVPCLT